MPAFLHQLVSNLSALGAKRLAMLGGAAAAVIGLLALAAVLLNEPGRVVLYAGLDRDDVNAIAAALGEAGIEQWPGSDGGSVEVAAGSAAKARVILAERGLPAGSNAGYRLFDNLGSLGLTSFMQEVTRVRALEGEIARTLQSMDGVKSARVHLAISDRGNFRRGEVKPSASVVVRVRGDGARAEAQAIRHLVAAAVPGLSVENVTVVDQMGDLIAVGDTPLENRLNRNIGVEQIVERHIEDKIREALGPYLGATNFRASIRTLLDTDERRTEETVFDPESRVERSVQSVRLQDSAKRAADTSAVTVEQNLPETQGQGAAAPQSSESSERREETTNYEINSKRIATVSDGYRVGKLWVSVVVNQARLKGLIGDNATQADIDKRVEELRKMTMAAAGYDEKRGDEINVSAVEFLDEEAGDALGDGVATTLASHSGSFVNAAAFIVVAALLVFFGVRPLVAAVASAPPVTVAPSAPAGLPGSPVGAQAALAGPAAGETSRSEEAIADITVARSPNERLGALFDFDEARALLVLRRWVQEELA